MSDEIKQNKVLDKETEYENLMKPLRDKKWSMFFSNALLLFCNMKFFQVLSKKGRINVKDLKNVLGIGFICSVGWIFILVGYNYAFMKYIVKVNPNEFFIKKKELEDSMIEESKYDFHTLIDLINSEGEKKI